MAERGAHLTGTVFAKPSIFEIAAHKSLAATLEPAAKKIITVSKQIFNNHYSQNSSYPRIVFLQFLASVNPEKYSWLYKWSDEVYLVLIAVLQNYYLNNYCNYSHP